ncbi:MAG: CapA family protein [Dictyoglomaceae bacterium]
MISIYFVGDIMLSRNIGNKIEKGEVNFLKPIKGILEKADILCGNLESPISDTMLEMREGFCAPAKSIEVIKDFCILNLANNHIYDCGSRGIEDTLYILKKHNILSVGVGKTINEAYTPAIVELKGKKIAFIGCVTNEILCGIKNYDLKYYIATLGEQLDKTIENLRKNVNFIVILIHGGNEFISFAPPSLLSNLEKLISLGADLIITHHPHVLGGYKLIEKKRDKKLIWYSLGDFIFDSEIYRRRKTGILTVKIDKYDKLSSFEFIPLYINEKYQVERADNILAKDILERIQDVSFLMSQENYARIYSKLYVREFLSFQKERFETIYKRHGLIFLLKFILKKFKHVFHYVKKFIERGYK